MAKAFICFTCSWKQRTIFFSFQWRLSITNDKTRIRTIIVICRSKQQKSIFEKVYERQRAGERRRKRKCWVDLSQHIRCQRLALHIKIEEQKKNNFSDEILKYFPCRLSAFTKNGKWNYAVLLPEEMFFCFKNETNTKHLIQNQQHIFVND